MEFIDLKKQYALYKQEIDEAIHRVLDAGQYIMGPQVKELEAKLAEYAGVKHCIGLSNGTDSLTISLRALDIGPGDEVITVPFTWISSAESIGWAGAKPVFVDIDIDNYNIDISKIEAAITPRTKAIIPVSLYGQMPDFKAINAIADKHGLKVVEDAAQSFGAAQNGIKSCAAALLGSTSFFPAKTLGCYGDGGALFTNDDALASKIRAIRTHGGEVRHHHIYLGTNARLDTLQAAILLVKLKHFPEEVEKRMAIGKRYSELLQDYCIVPKVSPGNTHVYHQYTIRTTDRERLAEHLKSQGIPTAVYYPKCLHEQPIFKSLGYGPGSFPAAEKACKEVISLPMHPWLSTEEQDKVINAIAEALAPEELEYV